jgi:hypothetical protein
MKQTPSVMVVQMEHTARKAPPVVHHVQWVMTVQILVLLLRNVLLDRSVRKAILFVKLVP